MLASHALLQPSTAPDEFVGPFNASGPADVNELNHTGLDSDLEVNSQIASRSTGQLAT